MGRAAGTIIGARYDSAAHRPAWQGSAPGGGRSGPGVEQPAAVGPPGRPAAGYGRCHLPAGAAVARRHPIRMPLDGRPVSPRGLLVDVDGGDTGMPANSTSTTSSDDRRGLRSAACPRAGSTTARLGHALAPPPRPALRADAMGAAQDRQPPGGLASYPDDNVGYSNLHAGALRVHTVSTPPHSIAASGPAKGHSAHVVYTRLAQQQRSRVSPP